jgi:DNA-binding transcriptional regulator PaaX
VLPDELLPPAWPAKALRENYFRFADELATRRYPTRKWEVMEASS